MVCEAQHIIHVITIFVQCKHRSVFRPYTILILLIARWVCVWCTRNVQSSSVLYYLCTHQLKSYTVLRTPYSQIQSPVSLLTSPHDNIIWDCLRFAENRFAQGAYRINNWANTTNRGEPTFGLAIGECGIVPTILYPDCVEYACDGILGLWFACISSA